MHKLEYFRLWISRFGGKTSGTELARLWEKSFVEEFQISSDTSWSIFSSFLVIFRMKQQHIAGQSECVRVLQAMDMKVIAAVSLVAPSACFVL
jgi:hypothetical protein